MHIDYYKSIPSYLMPKKALTGLAGFLAEVKIPAIKNYLIRDFIHKYGVNMQEALEENPESYACFNDFFIRALKPACRPLAEADLIAPVDGLVSEIGEIERGMLLQAKGRLYSVSDLLACEPEKALAFENGRFATLYLSPKDYHRVHMPMQGTLSHMVYVPGQLFSVQPATARLIPRLFARNERLVVYFNTRVGVMAMVLVGATIVGAIGTSWHGDVVRGRRLQRTDYNRSKDKPIVLPQGAEMGYFKLGSTVILLFAEGKRITWDPALNAGSAIRFGQALGKA
jgi:phosphatidylserine decarboxylase